MKYLLLLLFPISTFSQTTPTGKSDAVYFHSDTRGIRGGTVKVYQIDSLPARALSYFSWGAKDFDYTCYTTKALMTIDNTDSLHELTLPRKIHKEGDILKIVSLTNTADCLTYHLHYIGFNSEGPAELIYTTENQEVIYANPMTATFVIGRTKYY